jgi:hypothetical protein
MPGRRVRAVLVPEAIDANAARPVAQRRARKAADGADTGVAACPEALPRKLQADPMATTVAVVAALHAVVVQELAMRERCSALGAVDATDALTGNDVAMERQGAIALVRAAGWPSVGRRVGGGSRLGSEARVIAVERPSPDATAPKCKRDRERSRAPPHGGSDTMDSASACAKPFG